MVDTFMVECFKQNYVCNAKKFSKVFGKSFLRENQYEI